jgi:hypothetical protein
MAVPRLEEVAQRLVMARHETRLDDSLDSSLPIVRFTIRPWQGPWSDVAEEAEGRLEISVENDNDEWVVLRAWLAGTSGSPTHEIRIETKRFGAAWLEARILAFVGTVLKSA